jgi:hypothetical protein
MHRYKVWLLSKEQTGSNGSRPGGPAAASSSTKTSKLTDLETLLLLYNYGRPMEITSASKCILPDGQTAACETRTVSSDSVDFVYSASDGSPDAPRPKLRLGSPVSLDVKEVGAFGGVLTSQNEEGFQVAVDKKSQSLVGTRLAHIAVERGIGIDSTNTIKAGAARLEPKNKNCSFTDHAGVLRKGTIVNLSQFDALIRAAAAIIPPVGSRIVLRGPEWHGAYVINSFEIGFMVKFCVPIPDERFSPAIAFST